MMRGIDEDPYEEAMHTIRTSHTVLGENFGRNSTVAPTACAQCSALMMPCTWCRGRQCRILSLACHSQEVTRALTCAAKPACVCKAPAGQSMEPWQWWMILCSEAASQSSYAAGPEIPQAEMHLLAGQWCRWCTPQGRPALASRHRLHPADYSVCGLVCQSQAESDQSSQTERCSHTSASQNIYMTLQCPRCVR